MTYLGVFAGALALALGFYFLGRRHGRRDGTCEGRARLVIRVGPISEQR